MSTQNLSPFEIAPAISKAASSSASEAELRGKVHPLWEGYLREHGSDLIS